MHKIIVALYDHSEAAMDAVRDLAQQGYGPDVVSMAGHGMAFRQARVEHGLVDMPGIGPVYMSGSLESSLLMGQGGQRHLIDYLKDQGVPDRDANLYAEGVRRGGTLVAVTPIDEDIEMARITLNRYNPVITDDLEQDWRGRGWSHFDRTADPLDENQLDWPRNIAGRGNEKFESDVEIAQSNWPENITDPDRIPQQDEEEPSWPHGITARGDDAPEEEAEEHESNWPHNITARPDEE